MPLPRSTLAASAVLLVLFCVSVVRSDAATIKAASASYADVSAAVSAANSGDTVVVPAGTATWNTALTITKRIWLQGAGSDQTVIIGNVGATAYLIDYAPTDAFSTSFFRLTGFTLNSNNNSQLLRLYRDTITAPTYVRIDHNHLIAGTSVVTPAMQVGGLIYGVVDSNVFDNSHHTDTYGESPSGGQATWQNLSYTPGTADNLYVRG